jgi:plastocyanin
MTTTVKNIWVAIALAAAVLATAPTFPAAAVQAADTEVRIDNFAFAPQRTAVKAGTTVTWINEDDTPPYGRLERQVLQVEGARY